VRVATAALALSGAGLMITGVANAVTAPALAPGKIINGPLDVPGAYDTGTADPGAGTTAPADPVADPTTDPVTDPTTAGTTVPATDPATGPATATGGATSTAAATGAAPATTGGGSGGGTGMVQAAPRQTLAETGSDNSVPFLLAGGFTLLAGGLVFRFGPRTAAPRHGA
jgi:LPXTG-motif cell wall-anchored protein